MKRRPHRLRNITRLDYARTHAWWVRFQRGPRGSKRKVHSKMFGDVKYGGKANALKAAIRWRDENEHLYPCLPNGAGRKPSPLGVASIRATWAATRLRNGTPVRRRVFVARYKSAPNHFDVLRISITKYGVEKAYALAEAWVVERDRERRSQKSRR